MNTENNMHSLEDLVKCPICFENFKEPRSLPCSHIFCLVCLQRQEESDPTKFIKTCCICRQEIHPRKKASSFPTAFLVQQMVERMQQQKGKPYSQGDRHRMVDKIFNLFETRKQIKADEENRMKQEILAMKDEITKEVDETVEKLKQYLDSQRQRFLDSIDAECEKRLEKLKQSSQEADSDDKVKSWVTSNIDDYFSMKTPLRSVLRVKANSLTLESDVSRAVDAFLASIDLDSFGRNFSDKSQENLLESTGCSSSIPDDGALHSRNDVVDEPEVRGLGEHEESEEENPEWERLRSTQSDTPRVNNPLNSAVFPNDFARSDLSSDHTLTIDSVPKTSNDAVSVTAYIVDNREINKGLVGEHKYDNADCFSPPDHESATFISSLRIEHWEKNTSHETTAANAGTQLPGVSQRKGRICSAPTNNSESSGVPKPSVWRVKSNDSSSQRVSGMWRRFREAMVLNTNVVQDIAPSKRLYVHVTLNNTSIAVDEGTKMCVFANSGSRGRRRFIFDAMIAEEDASQAIIGITTLPNDDGWCMLLKNTLLVFNYHGVLNLKRSFPDINFLAAFVHRPDKFLFIDEDFKIGIAGFSGGNVDEVKILRLSGLQLTGNILGMATGLNILFIAHADAKRNVGTISCLSGLGSDSLVLTNDHEIHPPNGFHRPQSICSDQNGKLFVLWKDKDHMKGIIIEYTLTGEVVMSNTAFDKADRVRAITFSSEGRLVTCSL